MCAKLRRQRMYQHGFTWQEGIPSFDHCSSNVVIDPEFSKLS